MNGNSGGIKTPQENCDNKTCVKKEWVEKLRHILAMIIVGGGLLIILLMVAAMVTAVKKFD